MNQGNLFAGDLHGGLTPAEPPSQRHSETSRDAADAIRPHVSGLRRKVWQALKDHGPMTAEKLEAVTGLSGNCIRPRLLELRGKGYAREAGYGVTRAGRSAVLWAWAPGPEGFADGR